MSIDIQTNYADGSTIYTLTDEASFTLPSANSYDKLVIRNDSDDTIPIYAYGAETVDGRASFDLGPNICVTIQSIQQGGWIALQNDSSTTDVTVTDLSVIVEALN